MSDPPSSSSPSPDNSEFATYRLIGQSLGPYRIDGVLGRGGMGVVYQARHQQIGQEVAIKVLRQRLSGDRVSAERLLKEARAVTLVQHPGLVRIYDYQQMPDGTPYIVMERLRGQPLAERIQSSERSATAVPLPVPDTVRIAEQVAAALAAAHATGIIHCVLYASSASSFWPFHRRSSARKALGAQRLASRDGQIRVALRTVSGRSVRARKLSTTISTGTILRVGTLLSHRR